jgi:pimeloyl-ACP methyl ester carboxylesterase
MGRAAILRLSAIFLALGLASGSCAPSERQERTADLAASRPVSFPAADGIRLAGRLFGDGGVGVVLSHMLPADQTSWWDFARILAGRGYSALTYDARGYCPGGEAGCSEGQKDVTAMWQDVIGAIDYLESQGVSRVMLVGASMGGTASLVAASRPGVRVAAVVALSAPQSIEGLTADQGVLANVTAAKLFVAGNSDLTGAAQAAQTMYDESPPPKRVEIFTSSDHGTDLLTGNQSGRVQTLILNYLEQYSGT